MNIVEEKNWVEDAKFVLVFLILSIFSIEFLTMEFIDYLNLENSPYVSLIDSTFLCVMFFPILYFAVYKPLLDLIGRYKDLLEIQNKSND